MEIKQAIWFTPGGQSQCIGIVIGEDEKTHEKKAYIGLGQGHDEQSDIRHILDWGAKVSREILEQMLKALT